MLSNDARPAAANGIPDDGLRAINRLWTIARVFTNTAHQINNALQVITGNAELLAVRTADAAVQKRLETIRAEAERAAAMLNDLLAYARGGQAAPRLLDLAELADAAVAMRIASANRRRIVMTIERSDQSPFDAELDRLRGLQTLVNLLLAAEEWAQGGDQPRITVRLEREAGRVVVRVSASVASPRSDSSGGSDGGSATSEDDAFLRAITVEAQEWSAHMLAAADGGRLDVIAGPCETTYVLRWTAVLHSSERFTGGR